MAKTLLELQDSGEICNYCPIDGVLNGGGVYGSPSGPVSCEGSRCDEAYENYLSEVGDGDDEG